MLFQARICKELKKKIHSTSKHYENQRYLKDRGNKSNKSTIYLKTLQIYFMLYTRCDQQESENICTSGY